MVFACYQVWTILESKTDIHLIIFSDMFPQVKEVLCSCSACINSFTVHGFNRDTRGLTRG